MHLFDKRTDALRKIEITSDHSIHAQSRLGEGQLNVMRYYNTRIQESAPAQKGEK